MHPPAQQVTLYQKKGRQGPISGRLWPSSGKPGKAMGEQIQQKPDRRGNPETGDRPRLQSRDYLSLFDYFTYLHFSAFLFPCYVDIIDAYEALFPDYASIDGR